MEISWDNITAEDEDVQESSNVDEVLSSMDTSEEVDEHFSEVEKRLETAQYYRMLLNDTLFSNASEAARVVEREIRDFVRTRLHVLLGLKNEVSPVKSMFSDEEVAALKALAAKVMGKPVLLETRKVTPKPALKVQTAPVIALKAPTKPAINKVSVTPVNSKAPVKQAPKQSKSKELPEGYVRKGNKIFKPSGELNSEGQEILLDVTPTVKSAKALPMPLGEAFTQISASQASLETSKTVSSLDKQMQIAVHKSTGG